MAHTVRDEDLCSKLTLLSPVVQTLVCRGSENEVQGLVRFFFADVAIYDTFCHDFKDKRKFSHLYFFVLCCLPCVNVKCQCDLLCSALIVSDLVSLNIFPPPLCTLPHNLLKVCFNPTFDTWTLQLWLDLKYVLGQFLCYL